MIQLLGVIGWAGACVGAEPAGAVSEAVTVAQGNEMQGTQMQGTRMQGTRMQGTRLEGTALVGRANVQPAGDPSLAPCAKPSNNPKRDCGWEVGGIGICTPGESITVDSAASCVPGSCADKTLLRVCGGQAACGPGSPPEIAVSDKACHDTCPSVTFACPASGAYTVLVGHRKKNATDDIAPVASRGTFPLTVPVSGIGFIGATLEGVDEHGASFDIVIGDVEADASDPSGEILLYTLLAKDADDTWQNLCETDADGVATATLLAGTWDASGARHASTDLVTIGCTSRVLAKCIRWGYKPWQTVNGLALADYHQACTRMARADYCGNGQPHTRDGTLIDIWDNVPIQELEPAPGMEFEASWTPDGAYCLSRGRYTLDPDPIVRECPWKLAMPSPEDLQAGCLVKLTTAERSAIRTNNLSYLEKTL